MSNMLRVLIPVCIFYFIHSANCGSSINYCRSLCKISKGPATTIQEHIGCNNPRTFNPKCPRDVQLVDIDRIRSHILSLFNEYREMIASGKVSPFSKAERMPVLTWDDELEDLAEMNVKKCNVGYSPCRSTKAFERVGQSIALYMGEEVVASKYYFTSVIDRWFSQHKKCNMSIINKLPDSRNRNGYSDFALMVSDRVTKVGCAASKFTMKNQRVTFVTCNFGSSHMPGYAVYDAGKSGKPGSKCVKGLSLKYKSLCRRGEPVDPNIP